MLTVSRSVNEVVVKSLNWSSVVLDKECYDECPTKCTRQSAEHLAKSRIPIVRTCIVERHQYSSPSTRDNQVTLLYNRVSIIIVY
jgi:hypothetical protein